MELLTEEEGRLAVRIAGEALAEAVTGRNFGKMELTPVFSEKRGVFVTLTRQGDLRGCIGFPYPYLPLAEAIQQAARAAALEDPRFSPVKAGELPEMELEVTILTVPRMLTCEPEDRPGAIAVGKHGIIIKARGGSGLLLPQVATEWGWDAKTFLDHTCQKAGLPAGCWKRKETEVHVFEGQIFHLSKVI